MPLWLAMTFLTTLGVTEILFSFRLVLEGKTGKEIPESSRLEFLERFLANNFALSDAENNTSEPLNRGGIADLLLLRTLLAICQKSQEPRFWEVMGLFVLVAYASIRRKKLIQKSRTVRVTVRDPSRKVNHLSKVICSRKIITEFTRSTSSTRIG